MATKKCIAPIAGILLGLAGMLIVGIVVGSFIVSRAPQTSTMYEKGAQATEEIPCFKAPTVSLPGVFFINPDKANIGNPQQIKIRANADINSACFEDLKIRWTFTETNGVETTTETDCIYPYNNESCSMINHTYGFSILNTWQALPITVSAFGLRSAYYTADEGNGFVTDPFLALTDVTINKDKFSCVDLSANVASNYEVLFPSLNIKLKLSENDFGIIDNGKPRQVESVSFDGSKHHIIYRAEPSSGEHKVKLSATKGYQTVNTSTLRYAAPDVFAEKQELAVYGDNGDLAVYASNLGEIDTHGEFFPDTTILADVDFNVGDLDSDGVEDFAFLMCPGDLFALPYATLKSQLSQKLNDMTAERLINFWPWWNLRDLKDGGGNCGWQAVAIGRNIKDPEGDIGNIITLGNPGDLDLYKSAYGEIKEVEQGTAFADFEVFKQGGAYIDDWRDVAVYNLDDDEEDEILALRGRGDKGTGDLYLFKYKDYKNVKQDPENDYTHNPAPNIANKAIWVDIPDHDWRAVAAGEMDGDTNTIEIVALGAPGDMATMQYNKNLKKLTNLRDRWDWPNSVWIDLTVVDINQDRIDELAFLYNDGTYDKIMLLSFNKLNGNTFGDDMASLRAQASKDVFLNRNAPVWNAISAGDFACT